MAEQFRIGDRVLYSPSKRKTVFKGTVVNVTVRRTVVALDTGAVRSVVDSTLQLIERRANGSTLPSPD